jgi:FixJ family two-component response regulator
MPGINGRDLFVKAAQKCPGLKVIYLSGYTDNVIAHHGILDEGIQFIQKPFSLEVLTAKIREVLDGF